MFTTDHLYCPPAASVHLQLRWLCDVFSEKDTGMTLATAAAAAALLVTEGV